MEPKLIKVYDVRPFDWRTAKPANLADLDPQEIPNCTRCGRKHAVVWIVQGIDGKVHSVGSSCAKKVFNGWTPERDELKVAKREDTKRRKSIAAKKREEWAEEKALEIIKGLSGQLSPLPHDNKYDNYHYVDRVVTKEVLTNRKSDFEGLANSFRRQIVASVTSATMSHFEKVLNLTGWWE